MGSTEMEIIRYIKWIRDFPGEPKNYSIVFVAPQKAISAILGNRVNSETPTASDFEAEFPALSTIKLEKSYKLDIQFDDINERENINSRKKRL
jgi:hypothetical protein